MPYVARPSIFRFLLSFCALGVLLSSGQSDGKGGGKVAPSKRLRLLAIGDAPPHREEIVDDIRVHLPPPPGTIPPRTLFAVPIPETRVEWNPQLGRFTPAVELPAELKAVALSDSQAAPGAPPWLTIPLESAGDHLAILTRGGEPLGWTTPACVLLPDDTLAFPAGRVFFLNLAATEVPLQFGEEKFSLVPRRPVHRDPGVSPGLPLKAARIGPGQRPVFFHQGEILLNPGERALVLVYAADGIRTRQPIKLMVLRERAPAPSSPPSQP